MAKWISNSLPTTSFPCMLPTNLTFGRNLMLSLSVGRLPIPADILKGQMAFFHRDPVVFIPEIELIQCYVAGGWCFVFGSHDSISVYPKKDF